MTDAERRREYNREYYKKNAEKLKQYRHEHYIKNREKYKAYSKNYAAANPEWRKAYNKAYYEKHKNDPEFIAKQQANHARWQRENKDYVNAYHRALRAEKGVPDARVD